MAEGSAQGPGSPFVFVMLALHCSFLQRATEGAMLPSMVPVPYHMTLSTL